MKSQGRLLLFIILIADLIIVLAVVGLRLVKSQGSSRGAIQTTTSPQATPGLVVYGSVRGADGRGLENVPIYRSYAVYQGVQIAQTDGAGYYQSDFYSIPGDEMVTVWAELPGLQFSPENCYWRHYSGFEMKTCNFTAYIIKQMYLPLIAKTLKK